MLFNHVSIAGSEGNSSYAALPDNVHITSSSINVVANCNWDGEGYYAKSILARFYLRSGTSFKAMFESATYAPTASDKYAGSHALTANVSLAALNNVAGEYNINVDYEVEWSNGDIAFYSNMGVWKYVFDFYQYSAPTLPSFSVNRCLVDGTDNDDGTYVEATVQFAASSIGGNNALTLEIYRKLVADSAYTLDKTIDISALGMSGTSGPTVLTLEYLTNAAYDVKAVLTDLISTVNNVKTVQTAFKLVDFDSVNKKVALGKAAEPTGPSFDVGVGMDARFRDTVDFDKAPSIAAAEIAAFLSGLGGSALRTAMGIQMGRLSYSVGATNGATYNVTFPVAYSAAPKVFLSLHGGSGWGAGNYFIIAYVNTDSITADGFSLKVINNFGSTRAGVIDWIAIG